MVEADDGRKYVGSVERILKEDLVADGDVPDLIGGNICENVGLKPVQRDIDGAGCQRREDFIGNSDHELNSSTGERF